MLWQKDNKAVGRGQWGNKIREDELEKKVLLVSEAALFSDLKDSIGDQRSLQKDFLNILVRLFCAP